MHCNHPINMDMTAALGAICLAEAVLEVFQQTHSKDCILASIHRQHNLRECHRQHFKTRDPNWSINHQFRQCLYTLQLFALWDESPNKKDARDCRVTAWHKNKLSLRRALVFAFVEVGDCLGLPLGGINYTSFLKGPLWSSQESAKRASSWGV